jgi:hypothetical protein
MHVRTAMEKDIGNKVGVQGRLFLVKNAMEVELSKMSYDRKEVMKW